MTAQLIVDLRPAEIDGQHWVVSTNADGRETARHGPYADANAAAAMAARRMGAVRALGGGKWATS
jgi:hypothetical protein